MLVTKHNYNEVVAELRRSPILSVDTETTGLAETDRLFSVIIATKQQEYYFDKRVLGEEFLHDGNFRELFSRHCIFQNAKFDMRMLEYEGIECTGVVSDIAVLARLVRNDHMVYSLDAQAKRFGWAKDDIVKKYIKDNKLYETRRSYLGEEYKAPRYDRVPVEIMHNYACHDARLTFDLHEKYMEMLPEESFSLWEKEQRLTPILFKMERRGIKVDIGKTLRAREYEMGLVREAKARFLTMSGYHYDENNRKTLIKVFTEAGEHLEYTEKGNVKVDKDALKKFRSPIAQVVKDIRYYEKRISTYYDAFLNHADSRGVIHASVWQGGTTTGRFSYSDPNLQNVPKEDAKADIAKPYVVRECLVPREGHCFISIDYSQQEYRMMLDYAKERRMIDAVMSGMDVHQATAELLGITRKYAKTVNFAALYGAGPDKLAGMLGLTVPEARRLLDKYFMGLPMVDNFIGRVRQMAATRGYIKNWAGRRLYCQRGFDYAMPNHLIQGGCSDVTREAMLALSNAPLLLQVHDQLLFEPELEVAQEVIAHWKESMENVYVSKSGLRLTADVSRSDKSFAERDMQPWSMTITG